MPLPHYSYFELAIPVVSWQFLVINMKDLRYIAILIAMVMMGMASCEKIIPFEEIETEPLLVVNGIQKAGSPAWLQIEKSSFYVDSERDFRVKDVCADLYVNGVFKEALQVKDSLTYEIWEDWETGQTSEVLEKAFTYCEGTYLICEGDVLRFEVRSSEFEETAVAEVRVPSAPEVLSFDTVRIEYPENQDFCTVYFTLTIKDEAGQDYYNIDPQEAMEGFITNDPVYADLMNLTQIDDLFGGGDYYGYGRYNPFADTYFDGKEYTISMRVNYYGHEFYEPFTLKVSRVDEALYQYEKSYALYYEYDPESFLGMLTEPVLVYSNVQNGVGVVAAQSLPVTATVDLTDN